MNSFTVEMLFFSFALDTNVLLYRTFINPVNIKQVPEKFDQGDISTFLCIFTTKKVPLIIFMKVLRVSMQFLLSFSWSYAVSLYLFINQCNDVLFYLQIDMNLILKDGGDNYDL